MAVLTCPGELVPEVREAVQRQWPRWQTILTPRGDPQAEAAALVKLWGRPGDLVVIQQDKVPPPGSIHRLLECVHPWCGHETPIDGRLHRETLGLVRWRGELKLRWPDLMRSALTRAENDGQLCAWPQGDMRISRWMRIQGIRWHNHEPPVVHRHGERGRWLDVSAQEAW